MFGAVSTGGHMTGIGRSLRLHQPETQVIACDVAGSAIFGQPFAPYLLNGVGLAWRSANLDLTVFNKVCNVGDQEAISTCHLLAKKAGLLLGGSGGLVVFAAMSYLVQGFSDKVLCIVADSGINYLHQIFDENWLVKHGITLLETSQFVDRLNHFSFNDLSNHSCI